MIFLEKSDFALTDFRAKVLNPLQIFWNRFREYTKPFRCPKRGLGNPYTIPGEPGEPFRSVFRHRKVCFFVLAIKNSIQSMISEIFCYKTKF